MKYRVALLFALLFFSFRCVSQELTAGETSTGSQSPLSSADAPVQLVIERVANVKVSDALIQRIFRETVHEVAWQLNPQHPPRILAKVTLRLGAPGFTIETIEGKDRHTILNMRSWDELAFARMVARAARNGLFSDQELDNHARAGLARARALTSVTELQHH